MSRKLGAPQPSLAGRLIASATLHRDHIALRIDAAPLAKALSIESGRGADKGIGRGVAAGLQPSDLSPDLLSIGHAISLRRRGVETRIIAGIHQRTPDPGLVRVLAEARIWAKALRSGMALKTLVTETGHSEPYLRVRIALAFLSPKLQAAILEGRQRPDLSVARLIATEIPLDWAGQERIFG